MSQPHYPEENEADSSGRERQKKRVNVEIQLAAAQKAAARATVTSARYMLWAVIIATISTLISTAGAVYGVWAHLSRATQ